MLNFKKSSNLAKNINKIHDLICQIFPLPLILPPIQPLFMTGYNPRVKPKCTHPFFIYTIGSCKRQFYTGSVICSSTSLQQHFTNTYIHMILSFFSKVNALKGQIICFQIIIN